MAESEDPTRRFEDYRQQARELIRSQRTFQTSDHEAELNWNAPQQWTPSGEIKGGVLMVHGLGDSPWSFHDVGQRLADQGFVVRTVLLPGHGTKPEDMLDVTLEQWQQVVREQANLLGKEVPKVYLGGFSTGANLVLDYAYVLDTFNERFSHPDSRLIWYGDLPAKAARTSRVEVRTDYLPDYRISRFSHMGLLFSPNNPLYGVNGTQRICWNGQTDEDTAKCMAGEPVWYSDWGYREPGKIHSRLTFNPYFDWQMQLMLGVLKDADEG
ncbi:alpha/beta hydrolase [Pseudomonas viridiflava]|uniref:alpha/beta hydrolase n=1 Tax=Pseudomonas viridiflava TaxID=33069 RepID=UPI0013CE4C51|nr:alpha/beta fold hydrolase [Pseudomonas viridiflava]